MDQPLVSAETVRDYAAEHGVCVRPLLRRVTDRAGAGLGDVPGHRIGRAGLLRAQGVRVVAGTDAGAAPTKRHGAVWRAVLELVDAGYPMAEALATATSGAAHELASAR